MFKPMLAVNCKPERINEPYLASFKMEGVRGEFTPPGLFTRPLKKFNNPWLDVKFNQVDKFCREKGIYLEGEFYIHGVPFNQISSICRRKHHEDTDDIELHLFDAYNHTHPSATFKARADYIIESLRELGQSVYLADQVYIDNPHDAKSFYIKALELGYEGACFKKIDGAYKLGRSTLNEGLFLRMKEENTYDGVVVGIVERMENLVPSELNELGKLAKRQDKDMKAHTGLAAVAIVECKDFPGEVIRVTLSRKISDEEDRPDIPSRRTIWTNRESYPGKNIRFVGIPVEGMLPRAPRFDAWRTDLD
jgi:hypothetical protein